MVFDALLNILYELLLPQGSPRRVKDHRRPWVRSCKMGQFRVGEERHIPGEWNTRSV